MFAIYKIKITIQLLNSFFNSIYNSYHRIYLKYNKMINGSAETEKKVYLVEEIKEKYSNGRTSYEIDDVVNDCLSLIDFIENSTGEVKDPRVTIELAKLKKENNQLKKELSKFFPKKDSIESASKKLESLFHVDTVSLLRYENSELHEKNNNLIKETDNLKHRISEIEKQLAADMGNFEKLKVTSANLRMENSNLILQNRDILKRNKILEDQGQIVEGLQRRLRGALLEADKGEKFKETSSNSSQTDEFQPKPSKMLARLATKASPNLEINSVHQILCIAKSKPRLQLSGNIASINLRGLKKQKKVKSDEKHKEEVKEVKEIKIQKIKLHQVSIDSIYLAPVYNKRKIVLELSKSSYASLLPKIPRRSRKLQVSSTTSASLVPKKPLNKKPANSPNPANPLKKPSLRNCIEISLSILPKPKAIHDFGKVNAIPIHKSPEVKISLHCFGIFSRADNEEIEVFNAALIYRPVLSISSAVSQAILAKIPVFSFEQQLSINCRQKKQVLKLSMFSISNWVAPKVTLSTFPSILRISKLEIAVQRRFTYTPEAKNTDDEEAKSNSPGKRRQRTAPRKPAIEEYFNLV